jgi:hypothetical protein
VVKNGDQCIGDGRVSREEAAKHYMTRKSKKHECDEHGNHEVGKRPRCFVECLDQELERSPELGVAVKLHAVQQAGDTE